MSKLYFTTLILFVTLTVHATTFQQAVDRLLAVNLELMASKYEINFSRAQEITAGLWSNPSLFIDSQLNPTSGQWNQTNAGGPSQKDLMLTVPVDFNGKRALAKKVAKKATLVSELAFEDNVRQKIFELAQTMYLLMRINQEFDLLREREDLLSRMVISLQKRIGNNAILPLIQSRAKLALEEARLMMNQKEIERANQEEHLRLLLQIKKEDSINLQLAWSGSTTTPMDKEQLIEQAKKLRPDLIAIGILKEQIKMDTELQKKKIWDDISILGGISRQERIMNRPDGQGSPTMPAAWSWMVGLTIPLPVLNRNQGEIERRTIQQNKTEVQEKFLIEQLEKDIDISLATIKKLQDSQQRYKGQHLQNAKQVRDAALRQFGTGSANLIEYLDAINAYNTTISGHIQTEYELTIQKLRLKLNSGQQVAL